MAITIDGSTGSTYTDNIKQKFGTGTDLELFHDGSNSVIYDNGTGPLNIQTNNSNINIKGGSSAAHDMAIFKSTEGVELFFNNVKKVETTTLGAAVSGRLLAKSTAFDPDNDAFDATDYPLVVQNPEDTNADSTGIGFAVTTATDKVGAAIHHVRSGGGSQGDMRFLTSSDGLSITERMRITDSGRLLISTTSTTINSSNFGTTIRDGRMKTSCDVDGSNVVLNVYGNGSSDGFRVMGDGDCQNANNSYSSTSDETLKQDIVDAASQWEDIKALKVKKFRFKSNPLAPLHIGVIAQDLEKVSPGLVKEVVLDNEKPDEKVKTVKYSVLYMKAIKALQEAMAKIETLETKVAALEAG